MRLFVGSAAIALLAACSGQSSGEAAPANDAAATPAAAGQASAGTVDGAGRRWDLDGFTAVSALGSDDVRISVGPAFAVRAEGDAAALDALRIRVENGTLIVAREDGVRWRGGSATVSVSLPALTAANSAGSGDLEIDRVEGPRLRLGGSGSGDLTVGRVAVEALDVSLAGSGSVDIDGGETDQANVSVAGSGDVEAEGLTARTAQVSVMGSGSAALRVTGTANLSTLGSGDIDVTGGAQCTVAKSGSGDIRCR